jgi:hypothetical protein
MKIVHRSHTTQKASISGFTTNVGQINPDLL